MAGLPQQQLVVVEQRLGAPVALREARPRGEGVEFDQRRVGGGQGGVLEAHHRRQVGEDAPDEHLLVLRRE